MLKAVRTLCLAAALLVAGCDLVGSPQSTQPTGAPRPSRSEGSRSVSTATTGTGQVTVYFPRLFEDDTLGLGAVSRAVSLGDDPMRSVLEAFIRGPNGDERANDYQYALDPRTRVLSSGVEGATGFVELDEQLRRVRGRPFSELVYWAIVFTVTEVPGVERVALIHKRAPLREFGFPPVMIPAEAQRSQAPDWARPR